MHIYSSALRATEVRIRNRNTIFHNFRFMHAVADWSTGDWVGGASVDAEFIVEEWSVDAGRSERVPVFLDNLSEGRAVSGGKGVGKL